MSEKNYILSLDQGTTSSRAVLIDHNGRICAVAQREIEQHFPSPGWVEHNPAEIWSSQLQVAHEVLQKNTIDGRSIAAIGITNQRETTLVWDRKTGTAIGNAIVWQDRRTATACDKLKKNGRSELIQSKTGLLPDAYFSATKLQWLLDQTPGARKKAERGELAFGTVDSWLVWNLTGGKVHATDATNASRTMLYDIHQLSWDEELLDLFHIPRSLLPEVKSNTDLFGTTADGLFETPIPIRGMAGDQQAALFGQMCIRRGMVKNTYGTGCFIVMNTGDKPVRSANGLLSTIAWLIDGKPTYALEGSIFIAGAAIQWLRDGLKIIQNSGDVEALAAKVADNGGLYLVPAFTGLGAPHWDQHARGAIIGITRGTTDGHIARAALESIAYQARDVLDAMAADSDIPARELRADGGASANNLLMQFQADILDMKVIRPKILESTAMGAGYLAGLGAGFWKDIADIEKLWQKDRTFSPAMEKDAADRHHSYWKKAVNRAKGWDN
ncbi:MAG: glycerol kinase GlpK [Deltaproteobacteria bacterium]|nr:glycerol kinase GlpK [Deltaproteobacteria bacterium]